jgi:hypothetical protein
MKPVEHLGKGYLKDKINELETNKNTKVLDTCTETKMSLRKVTKNA